MKILIYYCSNNRQLNQIFYERSKSMNKKVIIILSIIAALVVLGALGYGIHHLLNPEEMNVMLGI